MTVYEPASTDNKQLEIIGLECAPKISTNNQLLIKNANSSIGSKFKLSKVDQTMLQLPRRTTFIAGRKAEENVLSRYKKKRKEKCTE